MTEFEKSVMTDSRRCDFCRQGDVPTVAVFDKEIHAVFRSNRTLMIRMLQEREFPFRYICAKCVTDNLEEG